MQGVPLSSIKLQLSTLKTCLKVSLKESNPLLRVPALKDQRFGEKIHPWETVYNNKTFSSVLRPSLSFFTPGDMLKGDAITPSGKDIWSPVTFLWQRRGFSKLKKKSQI